MKRLLIVLFLLFAFGIFLGIKYYERRASGNKNYKSERGIYMKITSPAFKDNEMMPKKYTCNGENINPPLEFSDIPKEAKSLVLIMDDPDAPAGTWVHWVVYNIDPGTAAVIADSVPEGGIEVMTSFGKPSYGGPCPPSGTHRYFFKLYALNKTLSLERNPDKATVLENMKDSIIAQTELVGLYSQ